MQKPDLAGMYVTDDHIDVIVGSDINRRNIQSASELELTMPTRKDRCRIEFSRYNNDVTGAFAAAVGFVLEKAPSLRSLGIGCYGPFESIDKKDRGTKVTPASPGYGRLQAGSRGHLLAGKSLIDLVAGPLIEGLEVLPTITVETDVATAATGLVYNLRSQTSRNRNSMTKEERERDEAKRDKVITFIKVSYGIGGAFIKPSTKWQGRRHPEMAQFQVPIWPQDVHQMMYGASWRRPRAMLPGCIEATASVSAIEARFGQDFETLAKDPEHPAWEREAWYLAHLAWVVTCVVNPHQIVFGGRIMKVDGLIERVRRMFREQIAASREALEHVGVDPDDLASYLVSLAKGDGIVSRPGILGALCLAAMEDLPKDNIEVVRRG